ncbi:hypothetical protein BJ742DRAFT_856953 [Cladochytrium replicatum]|nr:hypothetical protein BJ742DRAFT_856953 [Cladochytrium replicatum]
MLLPLFLLTLSVGVNCAVISPRAFDLHPCQGYNNLAKDGSPVAVLGFLNQLVPMGSAKSNHTTKKTFMLQLLGGGEKVHITFPSDAETKHVTDSWLQHVGAKVLVSGTKRANCSIELRRDFRMDATTLTGAEAEKVTALFPKITTNPIPSNSTRSARFSSVSVARVAPSAISLDSSARRLMTADANSLSRAGSQILVANSNAREPIIGDKRVVVVLIKAKDDLEPYQIKKLIYSDDEDSLKSFWHRSSYGKVTLRGFYSYVDGVDDIFEVQLPETSAYTVENICHGRFLASEEARAVLLERGIDVNNIYDSINWVYSRYTGADCSYDANANMPGKDAWYPRYNLAFKHETGHSFGFPHSSSFVCTDEDFQYVSTYAEGTSCLYEEYGDEFSVMGQSCTGTEYHGKDRLSAGWVSKSELVEVPVTSAVTEHTIDLNSLDHFNKTNGATRLIRIPLEKPLVYSGDTINYGMFYYVELRSGYTNQCNTDATGPMVMIRIAATEWTTFNSLLIDPTPSSGFYDANLNTPGARFTDAYQNISITVTSISDTFAQIVVGIKNVPVPPPPPPPTAKTCSEQLLLDTFDDAADTQSSSINLPYITNGQGSWGYEETKSAAVWTPAENSTLSTELWCDNSYCNLVTMSTALRIRVATDSDVSAASFDVGFQIDTLDTQKWGHLGSVTVTGEEGWVNVTLPFDMIYGVDIDSVRNLVFRNSPEGSAVGKRVYISEIAFVSSCTMCRTIRTVDKFLSEADLASNDISGAPYVTDGTGVFEHSILARWRPTAHGDGASHLSTDLKPNGTCLDLSYANAIKTTWYSQAVKLVTVDIGVTVADRDDCSASGKSSFVFLGTVTLLPYGQPTRIQLPLAPVEGRKKSMITGIVFRSGKQGSTSIVDQEVIVGGIYFVLCPGMDL